MDEGEKMIREQLLAGRRVPVYDKCDRCKMFTIMEYFPQTRILECPKCKEAQCIHSYRTNELLVFVPKKIN